MKANHIHPLEKYCFTGNVTTGIVIYLGTLIFWVNKKKVRTTSTRGTTCLKTSAVWNIYMYTNLTNICIKPLLKWMYFWSLLSLLILFVHVFIVRFPLLGNKLFLLHSSYTQEALVITIRANICH